MNRSVTFAVVLLAVFAFSLPVASARGTVDFCRAERDGSFRLQHLGARAAEHVVDRVGGGLVGDPVPGMPGHVFDEGCVPRLALLAEAWSTAPDGTRVDISRLEDTNGDGVPSAGDTVRTFAYPLDLEASEFGAFTVTTFVVADASLMVGLDGAIEVRAKSGCGTVDCWFFWARLDLGSQGYERYAEYLVAPGALPTDNTTLFDGRDGACEPVDCTSATAIDVMFLRPGSPSEPGDDLVAVRTSPSDDAFLDVAIDAG